MKNDLPVNKPGDAVALVPTPKEKPVDVVVGAMEVAAVVAANPVVPKAIKKHLE